jgi:biotin carboxylase
MSWYEYPVIVKPTDSAGSKGVTRVDYEEQLPSALDYAFKYSLSGHVIVEEFIEKYGCSSDTDSFSIDGKLSFVSFNAQHFDENAVNPYTPAAYSWPSTFTKQQEDELTSEIQRLISLLGLKTVVYNIETRIGKNGKAYIMELTPRGGGNRLCEMLRYATGIDMITAITRAMVGDSVEGIEQRSYQGHWAEIILHANKSGLFEDIEISDTLHGDIIERDLWVKPGDFVYGFEGANNAIGTLVLRFQNKEDLTSAITSQKDWLRVIVK